MGHFRPLFLYFRLFNTADCKCSIYFFADDWIWTADLWNWKQPLYQLSHNHCPILRMFEIVFYSDKLDKNQTGWFNGSNRLCSTHSYSDKQIPCTWSKQLDVRFGGFQTLLFFPFLTFILIMSRRARLAKKKNEQNKTWDNKKLIFSVQQNYTTLK